ncbi:response regulator [Ktedonobacteria bacterium brp13]|nr:response regulator [Ktedonobacteria bacterium brp13]
MSADNWIKLLQAIVWPCAIVFTLVYLGTPLKKFLTNLSEITFTAGPLETTVKRQEILQAAISLADAVRAPGAKPIADTENARKVARLIDKIITSKDSQKIKGTSILWVDDKPSNNMYERNAFESLGIKIITSVSTEDTLEKLKLQKYDLIISDMGRLPDAEAGYTLLKAIQKEKISTPFIIYAVGGDKPDHKDKAYSSGAFGSTSNALELFESAIDAIESVA